jgi:hypothetical protein
VGIQGGDQRNGFCVALNSEDDHRQDVGKFDIDDQEAFLIGLRWSDVQQRNELTCVGDDVLSDALVVDLQHFFDADASVAQDFD